MQALAERKLLFVFCVEYALFAQQNTPPWVVGGGQPYCGIKTIAFVRCGVAPPLLDPLGNCKSSGRCALTQEPNDPTFFRFRCIPLQGATQLPHEAVINPSFIEKEDIYLPGAGEGGAAVETRLKICMRTHQCLSVCQVDALGVRICEIDTQNVGGSVSGIEYQTPAIGPHQDPALYQCAQVVNSGGGSGSDGDESGGS